MHLTYRSNKFLCVFFLSQYNRCASIQRKNAKYLTNMFTQSFKHYEINCNIVYFFVIIHEICPISRKLFYILLQKNLRKKKM